MVGSQVVEDTLEWEWRFGWGCRVGLFLQRVRTPVGAGDVLQEAAVRGLGGPVGAQARSVVAATDTEVRRGLSRQDRGRLLVFVVVQQAGGRGHGGGG